MAKRHPSFEFHPEAVIEAREAADWYAERSLEASIDFKQELRKAETQVTRRPDAWAQYLHGTRCYSLKRFPYGLVYLERDDRIVGIAVAHFKRRPGYWGKRLSD